MKKFLIDHIDPLGQGVFKEGKNIYFIPNTLPGETGQFELIRSKKGVHFGKLLSITEKSPIRIDSECPHFNDCSGCHYLHTDYQSEIDLKKLSFIKIFEKTNFDFSKLKVITSPSRLEYRNRIQLHYNLKAKKIGFIGQNKKIIEVPGCRIANPNIKTQLTKLLKNWMHLAPKKPVQGHVELYDKDGEVQISWNLPYAHGGFTQVNQSTNELMLNEISEELGKDCHNCLDLFGGAGNLSNAINYTKRVCVDRYNESTDEFFNLNLFREDALDQFSKHFKNLSFDTLLIDPPRSGFKNFLDWIQFTGPQKILYVSCHPATMMRDLNSLPQDYVIKSFWLIDLFPSTFHFESMAFIERV